MFVLTDDSFSASPPKQTTTHFTNLIPVFLEKCPLWITGPGTSLIQIMAHLGSSSTSASFTRTLHLGRMGIPAMEDPPWDQIFFWSVETTNKNLLWPMWLEESDPIRSIENNFPWSLWFFPSCHGFLKPWLLYPCFPRPWQQHSALPGPVDQGVWSCAKTVGDILEAGGGEGFWRWCPLVWDSWSRTRTWRYMKISLFFSEDIFVQSVFFAKNLMVRCFLFGHRHRRVVCSGCLWHESWPFPVWNEVWFHMNVTLSDYYVETNSVMYSIKLPRTHQ